MRFAAVGLLRRFLSSDLNLVGKSGFASRQPLLERLETRRLMCAAPVTGPLTAVQDAAALQTVAVHTSAKVSTLATSIDGNYSGSASIDGISGKIALTATVSSKGTKLKFTVPVRKGFTIKPSLTVKFIDTAGGGKVATFNSVIGGGSIQVLNGKMTLTGTFNPLFAEPFTLRVTATKTATTSAAKASSLEPLSSFSVTSLKSLAVNPLVGKFSGKFVSGLLSFPYTAVAATKAGSSKLSLLVTITVPNFGDIQLSFGVSAHSNGSFIANLGTTNTQGTISGHFSAAGKLVLTFSLPGVTAISGTAKRL